MCRPGAGEKKTTAWQGDFTTRVAVGIVFSSVMGRPSGRRDICDPTVNYLRPTRIGIRAKRKPTDRQRRRSQRRREPAERNRGIHLGWVNVFAAELGASHQRCLRLAEFRAYVSFLGPNRFDWRRLRWVNVRSSHERDSTLFKGEKGSAECPTALRFDPEPMQGSQAGMTAATVGGRPIATGMAASGALQPMTNDAVYG
jgi:hypothetical protein